MDKVVYLVISDLHMAGQPKDNRYSYDSEIVVAVKHIQSLIEMYGGAGFEVNLIFMGDIFDRSYRKPSKVGVDISLLDVLLLKACNSYVVVGNHEINFYVNNPFWTMVNSIDSIRLSSLSTKNIQPLGYLDRFKVVDSIVEGDTVLHFNHFGCVDSEIVEGKRNFAFYHKAIFSSEVLDYAKSRGSITDFSYIKSVASMRTLGKYSRCFMGHLHTLCGEWDMDGTVVEYLPSLGRPHKDEVSDNFLDRNVPAICFKGGKFIDVIAHNFKLPGRKESVVEVIAQKEKEDYELYKIVEKSKKYLSVTDDPIANIKSFFADNPAIVGLVDKLLIEDWGGITYDNEDRISRVKRERISNG